VLLAQRLPVRFPRLRLQDEQAAGRENLVAALKEAQEARISPVEVHPGARA
jgi:hypothetical protein